MGAEKLPLIEVSLYTNSRKSVPFEIGTVKDNVLEKGGERVFLIPENLYATLKYRSLSEEINYAEKRKFHESII